MLKLIFSQKNVPLAIAAPQSKVVQQNIDAGNKIFDMPDGLQIKKPSDFGVVNNILFFLPESNFTDFWVLPTQGLKEFIAVPIPTNAVIIYADSTAEIDSTSISEGVIISEQPTSEWVRVTGFTYNNLISGIKSTLIDRYRYMELEKRRRGVREYLMTYFNRYAINYFRKDKLGSATQKDHDDFKKRSDEYDTITNKFLDLETKIANTKTPTEVDAECQNFEKTKEWKKVLKRVIEQDHRVNLPDKDL